MSDFQSPPSGGQTQGGERMSALLDRSVEQYRTEASEDVEKAQDRFGFTLFHSLAPEEKVLHLKKLGFEPRDAIDHYNLGCAEALQENFEAAIAHFEKALAEKPEMAEAVHNLALTLEKAGRMADAKSRWSKAMELTRSSEERSQIESHIATLG
jgi:tetratricopeptide (TPR) repeat protein